MISANEFYSKPTDERINKLPEIINNYIASPTYQRAKRAQAYLEGRNTGIGAYIAKITAAKTSSGKQITEPPQPIKTRIFHRLVLQKSQYSLVNGLYVDETVKEKLGAAFDTTLLRAGENAITHGAAYLYWIGNKGNESALFSRLEFMPMYDKFTGAMTVGVRFWEIEDGDDKILNIELYETTNEKYASTAGKTHFFVEDGKVQIHEEKQPFYTVNQAQLQAGARAPNMPTGTQLPIFSLHANPEKISDFTEDMEANIDRYDRISTDFGGVIDQTAEVYWVLSNLSFRDDDVVETLNAIRNLKATDGQHGEPKTLEVPHEARSVALRLLNTLIVANFCGMDVSNVAGVTRTATEIQLMSADLDNAATRFESEVYDFCQKLITFVTGQEVTDLAFKRKIITNIAEVSNTVISAFREGIIGRRTAMEKLPFMEVDEIEDALAEVEAREIGMDEASVDAYGKARLEAETIAGDDDE